LHWEWYDTAGSEGQSQEQLVDHKKFTNGNTYSHVSIVLSKLEWWKMKGGVEGHGSVIKHCVKECMVGEQGKPLPSMDKPNNRVNVIVLGGAEWLDLSILRLDFHTKWQIILISVASCKSKIGMWTKIILEKAMVRCQLLVNGCELGKITQGGSWEIFIN
jgi:hypothetical protein